MNLKFFACFLLAMVFVSHKGFAFQGGFDKKAFYKLIENGNLEEIDKEITLIEASDIPEKEAYRGTLLMRKAGLVKKATAKMDNFRSGALRLERAIRDDKTNVEYRFLRLIIQEHAPKITKYRNKLSSDKEYIKENFSKLDPVVQEIVKDYSKSSTILQPSDF